MTEEKHVERNNRENAKMLLKTSAGSQSIARAQVYALLEIGRGLNRLATAFELTKGLRPWGQEDDTG